MDDRRGGAYEIAAPSPWHPGTAACDISYTLEDAGRECPQLLKAAESHSPRVAHRATVGNVRVRHKGLRALHERDDATRVPADLAPRLRRILLRLVFRFEGGEVVDVDLVDYH